MSQAGQFGDANASDDVLSLTGNIGGPITPDAQGNINILGTDGITVSGTLFNNTLAITTNSGSVLQQVFASNNTETHISTGVGQTLDPNSPSFAAGTTLISLSITPTSSSNYLLCQFTCCVTAPGSDGTSGACTLALFQDGTSPGFFAVYDDPVVAVTSEGGIMSLNGIFRIVAGISGSTTITLKAGSPNAGTTLIANQRGGALATTLVISEIQS